MDYANSAVIEIDTDDITIKIYRMYNLLSVKCMNLDTEYAKLLTDNKKLSGENARINAFCQNLECKL